MELFYTIDRFEGTEWAILEDKDARTFNVPRSWLPAHSKEGDVVKILQESRDTGPTFLHVEVDLATRADRMEKISEQRQQLRRGPKGDVSL
jgi:hypothetical protein